MEPNNDNDEERNENEATPLLFGRANNVANGRYNAVRDGEGTVYRRSTSVQSSIVECDGVTGVTEKTKITLAWNHLDVHVVAGTSAVRSLRNCCCRSRGDRRSPAESPKHILKNVTGVAKPGHLLAILGASGAGKTTLLNVLNQRNVSSLKVDGDLYVNGVHVANAADIAAVSGYVQQDDLFIGTMTPREHLWFQAMLRMDRHMTDDVRMRRIGDVIQELGLTSCADTIIGTPPRIRGISGGERKRLAFASEVLTNPALLFCDEPTSGLDSFMAENVVNCLKKLASRNKTIVCTIHQPSSQVYALFDRLLLMAEGRVAYLGPTSKITEFFSKLNSYCPQHFNPADFYIHQLAIVPGREADCRQFVTTVCDTYEKSEQFADVERDLPTATTDDADRFDSTVFTYRPIALTSLLYFTTGPDLIYAAVGRQWSSFYTKYKASIFRQFRIVLWRSWLTMYRDPILLRSRLTQTLLVAVVFGLIYLQQPYNQQGVMNMNGSLFLLQTQMTMGFLFAVLNTFPLEFAVFQREHHNGMYSTGIYYMSKVIAEMPVFIVLPIIFSAITYWMIGLYNDAISFLIATATLLLVANVAISFGYAISCSTSNVTLAIGLAPMIIVPFMLFGGFYLNSGSVPVYFIWLKYISWFSYSNEILVVNQWKHVKNITCEHKAVNSSVMYNENKTELSAASSGDVRCFRTGDAVIASLSFHEDNVVNDFIILAALLVGFRLLSFILLYVRSRKRE